MTVGPKGFGFELTKDGIWSGTEEDGDGWSKVMVQMGTVQISGLPTIFTDVMSLVVSLSRSKKQKVFTQSCASRLIEHPVVSSHLDSINFE